ncbi:MAG TPA: S16 family serine protease [Actinomycetales bacterium]|nr:S16 family serine protease [Actinomycetales bacterium]
MSDPPAGPAMDPRSTTMVVCGLASVLLFAIVAFLPVPYVIESPGLAIDTLGESGGEPMIAVEGRETYPTSGTLELTTVALFGGPGRDVDLADLVQGWIDPTVAVVPEEQVFDPSTTPEEVEELNSAAMVSSQENATAAALNELEIDVPTTLRVVGFSEGSDAEAQMVEGDVVVAIDYSLTGDLPDLREQLQQVEPGTTVDVGITRDGAEQVVSVRTTEGPQGQTLLGVLVDPRYDFPFEVAIQIEDVGGPSAGLMFALGIVDKLTPGAMTGGERIAGTGTIDSGGEVGPIGGIGQKMIGASDGGADWFLAPALNCEEVVGEVPEGMTVVRVETLAEARDAVEAIGAGDAASLPSCARA